MIIWLVDYDGRMENLALMRLSTYHKALGDKVILKRGDAYPELWDAPDQVYISCIFKWNGENAIRLADGWGDIAQVGGTGVDITKRLPPEIENCPPDYSLYGEARAIGFISRGCIRNCPWCVVPRKEGKLRRVSNAQDIVGHKRSVIFLDNNFLALADHHLDLEWLAGQSIAIDFNQGLDSRLVTPENARLLGMCKWRPGPRLALDFPGEIEPVKLAIDLLGNNGIAASRITVFVLIGFSTLASDVDRLLLCREWGVNAFPMGYRNVDTGEEPAAGWDRKLYKKYRRLILRLPQAQSVWDDFREEVVRGGRLFRELLNKITQRPRPWERLSSQLELAGTSGLKFDIDLVDGQIQEVLIHYLTTKCTIEVKSQPAASDTQNVFIECTCRGKRSGIMATEAEWWAIPLGGEWYKNEVLIFIKTSRLLSLAQQYGHPVLGGDNNVAQGWVVPITRLVSPLKRETAGQAAFQAALL